MELIAIIIFCIPAGIPREHILLAVSMSNSIFLRSRRILSSRLNNSLNTKISTINWEIIVAKAVQVTDMSKTRTKMMPRIILIMLDSIRKYKGFLESPNDLRIKKPIWYKKTATLPIKYTLR